MQPVALFFLGLGLVEHDAVTGGAGNEFVFLHQIIIQLRRDVHEAAPADAAGHRDNGQAVALVADGGIFSVALIRHRYFNNGAWSLSSILLYGARTFLPCNKNHTGGHPLCVAHHLNTTIN